MRYLIRILVLLIYFLAGVIQVVYVIPASIIVLFIFLGHFICTGNFDLKDDLEFKIIFLPIDFVCDHVCDKLLDK